MDVTAIQALLLGIIQGATEFLPVSSSGHLVLIPWLLRWPEGAQGNIAFDTLVHWGTLAAVLVYFRRDLAHIVAGWWHGIRQRRPMGSSHARLGWFLILGSIPAGLAGLLLEEWFERMFAVPLAAACLLLGTALLLVVAERAGRRERDLDTLAWLDVIIIGCAQAVAIMPGISRSGATMAGGLARGLRREEAARFSFLLSIPAIAGAGVVQLARLLTAGSLGTQGGFLLIGFVSAAVVGYAAVYGLLAYVRQRPLYPFAIYCALMGLLSVVTYLARR